MTEREPDALFDALRDRLAEHGQEPPAHLWAGIRQQLPPPVAAPQLRKRRRLLVLLPALLLFVAGLSTWQWWQQSPPAASRPEIAASSSSASATAPAPTAGAESGTLVATNPAASSPATNLPPTSPSSGPLASAGTPAAGDAGATTSTPAAVAPPAGTAPARARASAAASAAAGRLLASTAPSTRDASRPAATARADGAAVTVAPARAGKPVLAAARPARVGVAAADSRPTRGLPLAGAKPNETAGKPTANPTLATTAGVPTFTEVSATTSRTDGTLNAPLAAGAALSGTKAGSGRATDAETQSGLVTGGSTARPAANLAPNSTGRNADGSTGAMASAGAPDTFTAWSRLQPRVVALRPATGPAPVVQAVADTFPRPALVTARRWGLQLLAGAALTYRQLSRGPVADAAAPTVGTSLAPNFYDQRGATTTVAELERPAAGFGAQVQLRRVLNGRWAVSAGLGYQEYAITLALRTVTVPNSLISNIPSSGVAVRHYDSLATSYRLRDTYRFLSVPLRLSYQLGPAGPRFRYGVLGGADLAFYLGGATTEGSDCGCQTQTWTRSNSPYRSLSLALNLGLDLRYRVAPQWELLAQPTGTYFLSSLARPASGFAPRHLLGAGLQLGVAYELR